VRVLGVVAGFCIALTRMAVPEAQARAAAFTALVACNVALIVVNRSLAGTLFRFDAVAPAFLAVALALGAVVLRVLAGLKHVVLQPGRRGSRRPIKLVNKTIKISKNG